MELTWWPSTGASRPESGAGADSNESWLPSLVDKKGSEFVRYSLIIQRRTALLAERSTRLLLTHRRRRRSSASKLQCPPCTLWRCIFVIHHHTAFGISAPPPATRRRILLRQRQFQLYNAARGTTFPFGRGMRQRIREKKYCRCALK